MGLSAAALQPVPSLFWHFRSYLWHVKEKWDTHEDGVSETAGLRQAPGIYIMETLNLNAIEVSKGRDPVQLPREMNAQPSEASEKKSPPTGLQGP